MRKRLIIVVGAALLALAAGCDKTGGGLGGSVFGSGPLTVTPHVAEGFQRYLNEPMPVAFAVSTDGRSYGYRYCTGRPCSIRGVSQVTIDNCRSRSRGVPCKILALREEIKWDGPVSGLPGGAVATDQPAAPAVSAVPTARAPTPGRPYSGAWSGRATTDIGDCGGYSIQLVVAGAAVTGRVIGGGATAHAAGRIDDAGNFVDLKASTQHHTATIQGHLDKAASIGVGTWKGPNCAGTFRLKRD